MNGGWSWGWDGWSCVCGGEEAGVPALARRDAGEAVEHDVSGELDEEGAQLGGEGAQGGARWVALGVAPGGGEVVGVGQIVARDGEVVQTGEWGGADEGAAQQRGGGGGAEDVGQRVPQAGEDVRG